jgi:C-terminal processing protease CtpA/Prc
MRNGARKPAAEYFAAILQDNKAATIVGQLTGGAGCGYTNGRIPAELRHSHAVVKMPDCVRLRKDGSDEVNGVTQDILVPWAERDTPYTKAVKLSHALHAALAAASSNPLSHWEWDFRVTKL